MSHDSDFVSHMGGPPAMGRPVWVVAFLLGGALVLTSASSTSSPPLSSNSARPEWVWGGGFLCIQGGSSKLELCRLFGNLLLPAPIYSVSSPKAHHFSRCLPTSSHGIQNGRFCGTRCLGTPCWIHRYLFEGFRHRLWCKATYMGLCHV